MVLTFKFGIRDRLLLTSVISLVGLLVLALITVYSMRNQMILDRITMVQNLTTIGKTLVQQQYDRYQQGEIDEQTAKKNAIETLRILRYANDEYFFIDDFDYYSVLLPIRPELEGTDVKGLIDSKGRYYVQMQVDAALRGGDIVQYEFTKPNTNQPGRKMAHVRPFEPWRWFIATGIYLDDVDQETNLVLWRAIIVFISISLVTGILIFLISRSITKPLKRLTSVIGRLTKRDYQVTIDGQSRADEIGDIARALELFKKTGQDFDILQRKLWDEQEKARIDREAALAFQRDSALRLEQTARLISMGEMAMSLAHELNQPLAAVTNYCMGCVRRLEAGTQNISAVLNAMRKATEQATRASRIIAQLRKFLRRSEPTLEPTSLPEIIEDTASIAEIESKRRGFAIEMEIPENTPPVMADRVMIEQVIFNLLRNAIEATNETAAPYRNIIVRTGLAEDGKMLETSVIDFGRGVAETEREVIFQPFHTTKAEGMGVGLNICRSIVEFHGGSLWMSPNPEGGVIFHFTLPIADRPDRND
jgi:Signal transduction histidine kinase regulating C4-dicarboxylate transport system